MSIGRERALVTGATSGIGAAIAVRLAKRGAIIGIVGRNRTAAEQVAGTVRENGGTAMICIADVSRPDAVERVVQEFVNAHGGIETVVSAAGVFLSGLVTEITVDDWHRVIATNLDGTFYLARFTVPELLRTRGSFTAISSYDGTHGAAGDSAYCASKHAVNGLIKCLALDYGKSGVRFNAVCPYFVETPMLDAAFKGVSQQEIDHYTRCVPLGRFASVEDVAAVAAHLSSEDARYTTGMCYALDGGVTAGFYPVA